MLNIFDLLDPPPRQFDWKPEPPPSSLDGVDEIFLNFETTGFRWWAGDRPISASITYGDPANGYKTHFMPWGFTGGNLDEAQVKRFFKEQVRGKKITNTNTKFEVHMARVWGIDLEEQGNRVADVAHYAALLDDHRQRFKLDLLIPDFLGHPPEVPRLDESRMASYDAAQAAPRAMYQTSVIRELKDVMWPELQRQNLDRVRLLEEELIFATADMEYQGEKIDVEKLELWIKQATQAMQDIYMEIYKETGLKVEFGSSDDKTALFQKLGIPFGGTTATGKASFTDLILKQIEHPTVKKLRRGIRLKSLLSKYLLKYRRNVDSNGILRYALHQLKEAREGEFEEGEAGTGFGRFSSTGLSRTEGTNIQQTIKVAKQLSSYGDEFIIRELHIPGTPGYDYLSADAMQIEYRLFANEAGNPKTIQAYKENPELSFHKFMHGLVKEYQPNFQYRQQKDLNFAKLYNAGLKKMALMLEFISKEQYLQLVRDQATSNHPLLQSTVAINSLYNKLVPEVKPVNDKAMEIAKTRGYIKTILGRRGRFPDGVEIHKALNRRIQGSGADIMKAKIVELRRHRKETGFVLRYPVHDSVNGDIPDAHHADKVREILNRQTFPSLKIPILWDLKIGKNWRECGDE